MVRPARFDYNPQTAASNRLQRPVDVAPAAPQHALEEFDGVVRSLESEGIGVCVAQDSAEPAKPDAIFPNNWVSFHADGRIVLYPMQAPNRRLERRREVLARASEVLGFSVREVLDLTHHEAEGRYLEGTGSLVLDHVNGIAYACRSPRTDETVLEEWSAALGYRTVVFDALDPEGVPFYHTNVMLSIGARAVVVASAAIVEADRARVLASLAASGRELIEIGQTELAGFAANVLELATWDEALGDCTVLVMSARARAALAPDHFVRLSACTDTVLTVPVPTIETLGGGGVRCMLAEVFLPE